MHTDEYNIAGALPLLDALEALRWVLCWSGLISSDQDMDRYIRLFTRRVRREPCRAQVFVSADFAARWKIAILQRRGSTYVEAQTELLNDMEWWAETLRIFEHGPVKPDQTAYADTEAACTSHRQIKDAGSAPPARRQRVAHDPSKDEKIKHQAAMIQT